MRGVQPTPVSCRKCGAEAGPPIYSEEQYGGRPALFWSCTADPNRCDYTWTLLIYEAPEVEFRRMQERLKDLERQQSDREHRP
mgnify:CR=1 FL=1